MISAKETIFISIATAEANKSQLLMKHGCVAVVNGKVLAKGFNDVSRTHSKDNFIKNTCSCHAEIACLRELYKSTTNTYGKYADSIKVV